MLLDIKRQAGSGFAWNGSNKSPESKRETSGGGKNMDRLKNTFKNKRVDISINLHINYNK